MGPARKYPVHLSDAERQELEQFVSQGSRRAREITRARVLLLADAGRSDPEIAALLGLTRQSVLATRKKYCQQQEEPLLKRIQDAPRSGRPIRVDHRVEAHITLLACSAPPPGAARWTLRLMADHLVRSEIVEAISHERVRQALKKTI